MFTKIILLILIITFQGCSIIEVEDDHRGPVSMWKRNNFEKVGSHEKDNKIEEDYKNKTYLRTDKFF